MAVEPRAAQHPLADAAKHVGMVLQGDFVLGKRPGFIGAQDIHGTEVLNRVQMLNDHLLL